MRIQHHHVTRITRAWADAVCWTTTAVLAVTVTRCAVTVLVRILADRAARYAVRTVAVVTTFDTVR